jgi:hypothetical protein
MTWDEEFKFSAMRFERPMTTRERLRVGFFERTWPAARAVLPNGYNETTQDYEYHRLLWKWMRQMRRPTLAGTGFGEARTSDSGAKVNMAGWSDEFMDALTAVERPGRFEFWTPQRSPSGTIYTHWIIPSATVDYCDFDFYSSTTAIDGYEIGLRFHD